MRFHKIAAIDQTGISEFAETALSAMCDTLVMYEDDPSSLSELIARAQDADAVLLSWRTHLSKEVLRSLPKLSYIGLCCTLYDGPWSNVDTVAAKEKGILVKGVSDYGDNGVVEFLFSELIRLMSGSGEVRFAPEAIELEGLKLGILGLGTVGRMVADMGAAFHMDVRYYGRTRHADAPYPFMELGELLRQSDVISAHLPRNVVLLQKEQFARMGQGKVLMNTGLQPCYENESFLEWIALPNNYAIFDAGAVAPDQREQYSAYPNIILGRHAVGFTRNARRRLAERVVLNAEEALTELEARKA
ncbi:MAG TPA: NAD(P)-dependent oxidoreductase [Clostridia bacterium]|nr:NAD(P)-dependent oxidoreductase [Clostridia bacterium]